MLCKCRVHTFPILETKKQKTCGQIERLDMVKLWEKEKPAIRHRHRELIGHLQVGKSETQNDFMTQRRFGRTLSVHFFIVISRIFIVDEISSSPVSCVVSVGTCRYPGSTPEPEGSKAL